jgi:hypothetical protein
MDETIDGMDETMDGYFGVRPVCHKTDDEDPDEDSPDAVLSLLATMLDGLLGNLFPKGVEPEGYQWDKDYPAGYKDWPDEQFEEWSRQHPYPYPLHDPAKIARWKEEAKPLLEMYPGEAGMGRMEAIMLWAYGRPEVDFWRKCTSGMKAFVTHMKKGTLEDQFNAAVKTPEFWWTQYYLCPLGIADKPPMPCPYPISSILGEPPQDMISKIEAFREKIAASGE